MSFGGIIIGLSAFLIIGVLHPVVIKVEYYFGKGVWPVFLVLGLASIALSVFIGERISSALLSVLGFSLLWSIRELFEQEVRVNKGWFPANPLKKSIGMGKNKEG